MNSFKEISAFVSIATRGSLSAAARAEGVTPAMMGREERYRPHPATWLNQERWTDEISTEPQNPHEISYSKLKPVRLDANE